MIDMLCGAAGMLLALGLLAAGAALGWKGRIAWVEHTHRAIAREATEEDLRRVRAEQQAFEGMLNYNPETAYGLVPELNEWMEDDEQWKTAR